MPLLVLKNVRAGIEGKEILKGVTLSVPAGRVHALMGPNGSGKSTLASVIMGHPKYTITSGSVMFRGKRINRLSPDERARLGLFLSFQYPVEVTGLSLEHFLRSAYNNLHPKEKLSPLEFRARYQSTIKRLRLKHDFAERSLNEGFSGGEKKKSEILQLALLNPRLAILDETDSGLDIDALKTVAHGITRLTNGRLGVLIITHYFRILKHVTPDAVHIMIDGRIVKSGGRALATQVEDRGYDWLRK